MNFELLESLLKCVHHFYPIGRSSLAYSYSGCKEQDLILTNKIDELIDEVTSPWTKLVDELKENFGDAVFDMGYLQFPSYMARIEVGNESQESMSYTRTLVINISLLCPYYTIYYEDAYTFHGFYNDLSPTPPVIVFRIFFTKKNGKPEIPGKELENVQILIQKYFRQKYINHRILFDYDVVGGFPRTEDISTAANSYPIYSFLFDGFISYEDVEVLD